MSKQCGGPGAGAGAGARDPTALEKCMQGIIEVFHKYADSDKDCQYLSNKEFKEMLKNELPSFIAAQKDPNVVDNLIRSLDDNNDNKVDFKEFLNLIAGLSFSCERMYAQKKMKK
ncbi:protein S100-A11-like [Erpetoichthys calabaricus]|uniref:Protein S100 n=1 Tax=Erpetoichthys calabaricus TaxID=27687 RepID=A0A8C4RLQ1_ERPCA|nr:protein S100-A11-like [Erpetoichthys calabaricus]